jgi:hypothetical protein
MRTRRQHALVANESVLPLVLGRSVHACIVDMEAWLPIAQAPHRFARNTGRVSDGERVQTLGRVLLALIDSVLHRLRHDDQRGFDTDVRLAMRTT